MYEMEDLCYVHLNYNRTRIAVGAKCQLVLAITWTKYTPWRRLSNLMFILQEY